MADIYHFSLQAKYECIMRVVSVELGFGSDPTALTTLRLEAVHNAAEQGIMDWAAKRKTVDQTPRPISNLQHLLDEYCAIADYI